MLEVLSITSVIFVLIAIGYASVRSGLFGQQEIRILGKYVVFFALPALIFKAVSTRPISEITYPGYLLSVLVGSLAVFGLGFLWSKHFFKNSAAGNVFSAMGMSCANSGFIGYPVLLMALPDVAEVALAMNMIVENLVMIPMVLILAECAKNRGVIGLKFLLKLIVKLCSSPILLALAFGFFVSITGTKLPEFIDRPINILASSSAAVSLIAIGGTLAAFQLRMLDRSVLSIVIGKLFLHPVAVGLALVCMPVIGLGIVDRELFAAAVIMASMPVMSIYPILAQEYGEEQMAALAMFVMTAFSFLTISLVMAVLLP